ncbi:hypothetical protein ATO49_24610 [Mycolicibacterium fortuitum subsp. fortuitum DSM 46621 = ATCC 6841 = JCM 6387]|nr:hypothetical protein ATO49_24610 [Mycolicibacterium fortuitum subsp. fortuitum DSM 46621 = ATCC 6841 = JCM 6387]
MSFGAQPCCFVTHVVPPCLQAAHRSAACFRGGARFKTGVTSEIDLMGLELAAQVAPLICEIL